MQIVDINCYLVNSLKSNDPIRIPINTKEIWYKSDRSNESKVNKVQFYTFFALEEFFYSLTFFFYFKFTFFIYFLEAFGVTWTGY